MKQLCLVQKQCKASMKDYEDVKQELLKWLKKARDSNILLWGALKMCW